MSQKGRPLVGSAHNPVGSVSLLRSDPQLTGLAAIAFFSRLAHEVLPSTFVLYAA